MLHQLQRLYAVERDLRTLPSDQRFEESRKRAKPILESLEKWLRKNPWLPKSRRGKALCYCLNRWIEKLSFERTSPMLQDARNFAGRVLPGLCWGVGYRLSMSALRSVMSALRSVMPACA